MIYTIANSWQETRHIISPWPLGVTHDDLTLCGILCQTLISQGADEKDPITGSFGSWQSGPEPLEYKDRDSVNYCPNCRIVRLCLLEALTSHSIALPWVADRKNDQILRAYYHGNRLTLEKVRQQVQKVAGGPAFARVGWLGYVNDLLVYDGVDYGKRIDAKNSLVKFIDTVLLAASVNAIPALTLIFDRKHNGYYRFVQALKADPKVPAQFRSLE